MMTSRQPLIRQNIPLVGINSRLMSPFVGIKRPFVKNSRNLGFSILELVITLVIFGALAAYAIPSFVKTVEKGRSVTQANSFLANINFARNEARKLGSPVSLCIANAAGTGCNNAGVWEGTARLVWNDLNANLAVDVGEQMLQVGEPFDAAGMSFKATDVNTNTVINLKSISFNADGKTNLSLAGITDTILYFKICYNGEKATGRKIMIGVTGTARVLKLDPNNAADLCV